MHVNSQQNVPLAIVSLGIPKRVFYTLKVTPAYSCPHFVSLVLGCGRLLGEHLPAMTADHQVTSPPSFCSWWICSWSRDDRQRQGLPPQCCDGQQTHTHTLNSHVSYDTRHTGVVHWHAFKLMDLLFPNSRDIHSLDTSLGTPILKVVCFILPPSCM